MKIRVKVLSEKMKNFDRRFITWVIMGSGVLEHWSL